MTSEKFSKEDFEEGTPRFIPMKYGASMGFYIFDTERLDFLGFSNMYTDIHYSNMICDIINTLDYLLKEKKE